MRVLDKNGVELTESAELYEQGTLVPEIIQSVFHEAVEAVEEVWHYETTKEFPNGGKEVRKVIDVPGQRKADAWWENEEILRFTPFTEEELLARKASSMTAELRSTDTAVLEALEKLLGCSTVSDFIGTLISTASELKDVIETRAALRAQIAGAEGGEVK